MCLALLPALLKMVGDILNLITTVSKSVYSSHTEQRVWRGKGEKTNGEPSLSSLEDLKQGGWKNELLPGALCTKITS